MTPAVIRVTCARAPRALPAPLVVLVTLLGAGCGRAPESADATTAATPPEVAASTVVVRPASFTQTITATGTVIAAPGTSASLSAPAAARVARVFVAEGDRVRAGDPLVAFDRTTFDADLARAAAAVAAARHTRDQARRLTDLGVAPRKELDQALAGLADAEASLATARRAQSLATLRAPLSGVVARVTVVRDESVDPSRTVVEVVDPARLAVVFGVPPRNAALVHPGSMVALASGAGGEPLGTARVIAVGSTVDTLTRNVTVRARLVDRARTLRIGEAVVGRIAGPTLANVIAIPVEALVPGGERFHVFVVDAAGIAHAREVRVLAQNDRVAQIASGLQPGETVVSAGAFGVDEGARIAAAAR